MKLRSIPLLLILVAVPACPSKTVQEIIRPTDRPTTQALSIAVVGPAGQQAEAVLRGARMAAARSLREKVLPEQLQINLLDGSATTLAGLTDDAHVLGAVTVGGFEMISAAREVLSSSSFVVIEVSDDLYELSLLGPSVFQGNAPRSWQAFRLARYFGPGDRGYRKIGLAREPGPEGDSVAQVMSRAADLRGIAVIDSPGDAQGSVDKLRSHKPEAVVVEGSKDFISATLKILSDPSSSYAGRSRIKDGWRPQTAGFASLLAHEPMPGSVAGGDYARPAQSDGRIQRVEEFRKTFRDTYNRGPSGDEIYGYEAVSLLAEAAKRSGTGSKLDHAARVKLVEELERFDRVRFAQLPISLGPDDHVIAERDVLGLYCFENGRWLHLMRTFTSDLERTNLLEEDWASYFDGAVPGGEAPFFHQAKGGVTTDRTDDLR